MKREQVIENLKADLVRQTSNGGKVSKADIGRVLDASIKGNYESIYETRVYKNYGSEYCVLLELISDYRGQGKLRRVYEEAYEIRREGLYCIEVRTGYQTSSLYIYNSEEAAREGYYSVSKVKMSRTEKEITEAVKEVKASKGFKAYIERVRADVVTDDYLLIEIQGQKVKVVERI